MPKSKLVTHLSLAIVPATFLAIGIYRGRPATIMIGLFSAAAGVAIAMYGKRAGLAD